MVRILGLTKHLRVTLNAWHFYYALVLVIKVVCGRLGILRALYLNKALCVCSLKTYS
ncbi:TPA: DUF3265 domain-containing protein [Vibrio harveyi]|nr:DUF3265 domain-containing protein [Vibrio harveyi]